MKRSAERRGERPKISSMNGFKLDDLMKIVEEVKSDPELGACKFRVSNKWIDAAHNCTMVKTYYAAKQEMIHAKSFELHADEPPILAGADDAPNPVEHLLNALASCLTTSIIAHAAVRGIHIEALESELEGDLDLNGFLGLDVSVPKGFTEIRVKFKIKTDEENIDELRSLMEFSPVYNTILKGALVDVVLEKL